MQSKPVRTRNSNSALPPPFPRLQIGETGRLPHTHTHSHTRRNKAPTPANAMLFCIAKTRTFGCGDWIIGWAKNQQQHHHRFDAASGIPCRAKKVRVPAIPPAAACWTLGAWPDPVGKTRWSPEGEEQELSITPRRLPCHGRQHDKKMQRYNIGGGQEGKKSKPPTWKLQGGNHTAGRPEQANLGTWAC